MNDLKSKTARIPALIIFMIAGLLALGLVGCGGPQAEDNKAADQSTENKAADQPTKEEEKKDPLVGEWKISAIEGDGMKMEISDELLDAMGQPEMKTLIVKIDENMKVDLAFTNNGETRSQTGRVVREGSKITGEMDKVENIEFEYFESRDELIMTIPSAGSVYMKRI